MAKARTRPPLPHQIAVCLFIRSRPLLTTRRKRDGITFESESHAAQHKRMVDISGLGASDVTRVVTGIWEWKDPEPSREEVGFYLRLLGRMEAKGVLPEKAPWDIRYLGRPLPASAELLIDSF